METCMLNLLLFPVKQNVTRKLKADKTETEGENIFCS